ncbi:dTDP-4-amino-4,6-dideoxygalactose transaminase [Cycloclasticus pugetii]|jgi:dTDP-4-amino-4,6-dideoxygalactose transaminase|uniref:dTDP-4-amino-4,6-dideoxygalactose transaminase n=1 Tax=Cycloclasticus pugetii TaxID=34068 RepID=UPI00091B45E0|nr:dTDP-4-amino-4,6-dideoxygalactose transaminase [Cycloclasticus pugetii]SHJ54170.1 dTDP-4-amino-4,6-dideoxygalactose transaminase [Cycloclasticus pugetii]
MKIGFNRPPNTGNEQQHVLQAMQSNKISGDGVFGSKCQSWFEEKLSCKKALLTPSCTAALEMATILIDIQLGDEVIMPSYTFVSTANAFVLRGAKIVFVDIRPDTMNIDEKLIEAAITPKTKAIVPVHYAGVACEMDTIMCVAKEHDLFVIEDAAQGMMSFYKGRPLGTIGHLGAYSFHETKNYTSGGEGGLLIINDTQFIERAEIIREKGTNRSQFFRGEVDKYSWVDIGSSYLMSELQAAYLWGQLEQAEWIKENRLSTWNRYYQEFICLQKNGQLELPKVCEHNGHMFYLKLNNISERDGFIRHMKEYGVMTVFHYVPLHSSLAGRVYGEFSGSDKFTTMESERLVRLPIWYGISKEDVSMVIKAAHTFFQ